MDHGEDRAEDRKPRNIVSCPVDRIDDHAGFAAADSIEQSRVRGDRFFSDDRGARQYFFDATPDQLFRCPVRNRDKVRRTRLRLDVADGQVAEARHDLAGSCFAHDVDKVIDVTRRQSHRASPRTLCGVTT